MEYPTYLIIMAVFNGIGLLFCSKNVAKFLGFIGWMSLIIAIL